MLKFRRNRNPVYARRVAYRTDDLPTVGVDDINLRAVRNVEPSRSTVQRQVIEPAGLGNWVPSRHMIARLACQQWRGKEQPNHYEFQLNHCYWLLLRQSAGGVWLRLRNLSRRE